MISGAGGTRTLLEQLQAVTLTELVVQRGPLPPEQVADIARQVLSALESAHAAGIVHRDVKPSNIMVSGGRVTLADFGIAQTLDDPRLTSSGAIVGSPAFMAPERIRDVDATPAADLCSLGATLFFAVEGWMPFERQTTAAPLHAVLNESPRLSRPHGPLGSVITAPQVRALLGSAAATGFDRPQTMDAATRTAGDAQPGDAAAPCAEPLRGSSPQRWQRWCCSSPVSCWAGSSWAVRARW